MLLYCGCAWLMQNGELIIEQYKMQKPIVLILVTTTLGALSSIILNIWFNTSAFGYNLQIVPGLQQNKILGSKTFLTLMNIVSNIFNPILCAGYVLAFYLLSFRRFQILGFLVWFVLLSVGLTFFKQLIQQARPYWIADSGIQMLQWTCYTEFGCPSGHSMLGLVLIEFMVSSLKGRGVGKIGAFVIVVIGLVLQGLVVFSRLILGMHSLNQVLFGLVLGFYSFIIYYLYMQKQMIKLLLWCTKKSNFIKTIALATIFGVVMIGISLIITYIPVFPNNQQYTAVILTFQKCKNVKEYKSFQWKCLEDASLAMVVVGILYGLAFLKGQQRLMKVVKFPRASLKYVLRILVSVLVAGLPVAIFMNPLWKKIQLSTAKMATMLFFLQGLGLMTGIFFLIAVVPIVLTKLGLQQYLSLQQSRKQLYNNHRQTQLQITSNVNRKFTKDDSLIDTLYKNDSIAIPKKIEENNQTTHH